jgi:hypothetical protein
MKTTIRLITTSLFGLAMMAMAQTTNQKLPAEAPAPNTKQVQPGNRAGFNADSLDITSEAAVAPALSTGWNYIHPKNCALYYSSGYPYLYVYATDGRYFYTTNTVFQALINPACQTGNWLAFYVYNSSGSWSEVYTYTYK